MVSVNKITHEVWRSHTLGQRKNATKRVAEEGGGWTKFEKASNIGWAVVK